MLNYQYFYKWVESHLGIRLDAYKEKQLHRRIQTVMRQSGATTLEEYAELIERDDHIKMKFLDYITINVTEFFRNKELFEKFEEILTTDLSKKFDSIAIWSAACSIGAEPYSLAMIVDRNALPLKRQILATDIDETILKKAQKGQFKRDELKNVSPLDLRDYFTETDGVYAVDQRIKDRVSFRKHDLVIDPFESDLHVIVCRNVTIYFKNEAKDDVYRRMSSSLVKGGLLFTGATETIYQPEQYGLKKVSSFIYEKFV